MSVDHAEESKTRAAIDAGDNATIETEDASFAAAVSHGVQSDELQYGKLFFWSGFLIITVIAFVVGLMFFSEYSFFNAQQNASVTSTYRQVSTIKAEQTEELNSFGVVDQEKGIYHIPIEEAINTLAVD